MCFARNIQYTTIIFLGSLESAECSARDSSHSTSSPGLSNDSAVESWDQNTPVRTSANCGEKLS